MRDDAAEEQLHNGRLKSVFLLVQISTLQAEITEWQMELSAAEAEVSRLTSVNHKGTSNLLRPQSSGPKNRGNLRNLLQINLLSEEVYCHAS